MPQIGVGGRKVYYEVHGDQPGVPLLLLMGMAGSCRGWLPLQVPAFCSKRRTVIFDHRGAGGSDDPGGPFSTPQFADDTVDLLDTLEIECADVLGVFMGGMVAQEIALRHPDRVNRLLLTGTFARPDAKRRLLLEHWRDLAKGSDALEVLIRERLLWTLMDETLEQTDLIQSMVDYFKREGLPITADVFVRQCEACLRHDTSDRLAEIPHPTLIVCGERDRLTPLSMHRQLAEAIPNSHLVAINYGAHMVMVESAEHFNRVVLQFVADDR